MEVSLGRVVEEVLLVTSVAGRGFQEGEGAFKGLGFFFLGQGEHEAADGSARAVRSDRTGISETAFGSLALKEKTEALLDGVFRDSEAGVARGEERDHLRATNGGVGIDAFGRVAPRRKRIAGLGGGDQ